MGRLLGVSEPRRPVATKRHQPTASVVHNSHCRRTITRSAAGRDGDLFSHTLLGCYAVTVDNLSPLKTLVTLIRGEARSWSKDGQTTAAVVLCSFHSYTCDYSV